MALGYRTPGMIGIWLWGPYPQVQWAEWHKEIPETVRRVGASMTGCWEKA